MYVRGLRTNIIECHCCQPAISTVNSTSLTYLNMTGIGTAYRLRCFLHLHRSSTQLLVLKYIDKYCAYVRKGPSSVSRGSPPISQPLFAASDPPLRILSALKHSTNPAIFKSRCLGISVQITFTAAPAEKPYDARPRSATGSQMARNA